LPVRARREGEVFGLHTLSFDSEIDTIRLQHEAKSRRGFARGAVTASEWLVSQASGVYTMADYLGL
jgi:4-hydroxy-tetrahydrodipicolinate reductase